MAVHNLVMAIIFPIAITKMKAKMIIYPNSKSKRYLCWQRRRLPQRMYNTSRRLLLAAPISSLI